MRSMDPAAKSTAAVRTGNSRVPVESSSAVPRRRRFGWFTKLGFLLASLIVAVGLTEAALWIFAPIPFADFMRYEPDGHIKFRPLPNQSIKNAAGYTVRINREGFRGPDYAYEKPRGTLRIAVFGGSAAFDFAASAEEKSWPGAVEAQLREKLGIPVQVINCAVPGFESFSCKINYLYTGRDYHPDAVILYETWNDMGLFRQIEKAPYRTGAAQPAAPLWQRLGRLTQIGRRAHPIVRRWQGRMRDDVVRSDASRAADLDQPAAAAAMAWDRQNFVDFANFAHDDGVLPILISMAFLGSQDSLKDEEIRRRVEAGCVERGFNAVRGTETLQEMSRVIEAVAAEHGAIFVDGYQAVPHDLNHIRDNVHFYELGSRLLAEACVKTLMADPRFMKGVARVRAEKRAAN